MNFNGLSEHVKNWKIKNQSLHWFGLTELNKQWVVCATEEAAKIDRILNSVNFISHAIFKFFICGVSFFD